jgi:hydrogenase nickel incorporation protein HypA/HybF
MHEVAAMHDVVATALDAMQTEAGRSGARGSRVTSVQIALGASGHLSGEAARLHFDLQAAGTPAEGARLDFIWLPATYQCFMCLRQFDSVLPPESVVCPDCGGVAIEIAHDDTITVRSITVEMEETVATPARTAGEASCVSASPDV